MIDLTNMYIQKAHRLSLNDLDAAVVDVRAGQLFQLNAAGKWVVADGTKKAYPTLNNRYPGLGLGPQGERLEGRDDVSRAGKIAVLLGNFEIGTDQYDTTKTFVHGTAVYPGAGGKVVPFDSANGAHKPEYIVGFVTHVPANAQDYIRYGN